jgi:hypothetical protein
MVVRVRFVVLVFVVAPIVGMSVAVPVRAASRTSREVVVRLNAGDLVAVSGTHLRCVVSSSLPRTIVCGLGDTQKPFAGSYGFAVADRAALFLKASASRQQPELVLRRTQPTLVGASFPSTHGVPRTRTVRLGTALEVSDTHIACLVMRRPPDRQGLAAVTCGLHTTNSDVFVYGSYLGTVTSRYASLQEKPGLYQLRTVIRRTQP